MSSADQIPQTIEQAHEVGFHESGTVTYCLHCAAARSGDALRGIVAQRDQLAAACDVFRGRIQALEMERGGAVDALLAMTAERDAARVEGARLRERVKRLEAALVKVRDDFNHAYECSTDDDDDVAGCECAKAIAVAALSPTTNGAPKPADICPRNADGIHRPWHDDGAEDLCRCGKVVADGAPKPTTTHAMGCAALRGDDRCDCGMPIADGAPKPKCATCGDSGEVQAGTGTSSSEGGEDWTVEPCPACKEKP